MEALEKKSFFAMSPLGAVADAGWTNSGEVRRGLAGEGLGRGLGALGAWFGASDRAVAAPASGSPAASECGRRSLCCGAAEPRRGWSGVLQGRGKEGAHA
jgi:hypothetical protein